MMTLTNEDLQAIGQLLDIRFKSELHPIKEDISGLRREAGSLKKDVTELKEDTAILKGDVTELKEDTESIEVRQTRIELLIENDVCRGINILRENYLPAAKKYKAAVDQIEGMKCDIEVLKTVVTKHSEKFQMLGV